MVIVLNDAVIANIQYGWDGMVGRDLNRRLRTLEFRARASAGRKTGNLRARMETTGRKVDHRGLEARVGAPVKYALVHHQGSRPHVIKPRKAGGTLRFVIGGRVIFAKRVNHPGTRPNHYLTRWLRETVR